MLTHKIYVGQTIRSLKKRIQEHKKNTKSLIGRALHKYGEENFVWVVLEECNSRKQLLEREIFWIRKLNCLMPKGYNIRCANKTGNFFEYIPPDLKKCSENFIMPEIYKIEKNFF